MATQGIDVRQTADRIILRVLLLDSDGAVVTAGTTNLKLYELQDDGTLYSYDWDDDTFKSTALTTENQAMTHRTGNNDGTNTGIWTHSLTTLSDFNTGGIYFASVSNSNASPDVQVREFQFGNAQGDLTVTATHLNVNVEAVDEGTDEAARLEAALTTSNGININKGQGCDSEAADTIGKALENALDGVPSAAPGANGGLPTVDANNRIAGIQGVRNTFDDLGSMLLVNSTCQAGSSASAVIADAADLPTDTDDIYNNLLIIVKDVDAGYKPNVRLVSDYIASSNTFQLDEDLDFSPSAGNDLIEVWAVAETGVMNELLKLSTGFSVGSPNNLNAYLKAVMHKAASLPSGLGTYAVPTDSLEAQQELASLAAGAGFSTSTDSQEAIRNYLEALIAPAVVSSSALSGSGFLADCVSLIRKMTDEPSVSPKYTDADLVELIQSAFDTIISDINLNSDHPIVVRHNISVSGTQQDYLLPPNVGEIWHIAKINDSTQLPGWEIWPSNEWDFSGRGFTIQGNMVHLMTPWNQPWTLQISYIPNGEPAIHKATASAGTASSITFPASVTDGTLDIRPNAYAGYLVRILENTGAGQERVVSAYDTPTGVATIRPDWTTTPDNTSVYEVLPYYSRLIKHVVCLQAALDILGNEANQKRTASLERRLSTKMRAFRLMLEKKNSRFPGHMNSDTTDNDDCIGYVV